MAVRREDFRQNLEIMGSKMKQYGFACVRTEEVLGNILRIKK